MLISKKWLQSYFKNKLPTMKEIADLLLVHSFEIEGLYEKNEDWILDIDVLPNRAHDCLCHEGVAKEIAGLIGEKIQEDRFSPYADGDLRFLEERVSVKVENSDQCLRYSARLIKNIEVHESPQWLKNRINSVGQKSINALVDATNFILFDMGQPMHVFDADKVVGSIIIRNARDDERMVTLNGDEINLNASDLVISDEEKILALAGIKGGKSAEVTDNTKNIIIESANFHPIGIRKTARRIKIFTDASKRYENGITSEKVLAAMESMTSLIMEVAGTDKTRISQVSDLYKNIEEKFTLNFSLEHTSRLLGFSIKEEDVNEILKRFQYSYVVNDGVYSVSVPYERLDLRIAEDFIEEIGRIYGYQNIPKKNIDEFSFRPEVNNSFLLSQKLRNYFIENGFTEIMNYTFLKKGEVELINPLASDKRYLRKNLSNQMKISLEKNVKDLDFLGEDQVLNFEIDNIHTSDGEKFVCVFGINSVSKKSRKKYGNEKEQIEKHKKNIREIFRNNDISFNEEGNIVEFTIDAQKINNFTEYGDLLDLKTYPSGASFQGISIYPYIRRDISFWIKDKSVTELKESIIKSGANFLQKVFLFDKFEKEGKISYAFSMFFQSFDKTLTDEDVEKQMQKIYSTIKSIGGKIR